MLWPTRPTKSKCAIARSATASSAGALKRPLAGQLLGWLGGLVLGLATAQGQTSSPAPANRFLLIVETSHAMEPRATAALQTIQELLNSGLKGQARPGDTVGVWTYNDELHAGEFPLQDWPVKDPETITSRCTQFLKAQPLEGSGRLNKLWPALQPLIQGSDYLTIILVSVGEDLKGSPFDAPINAAYKKWHSQQKRDQMPFVTALRAEHGTLVDYKVTPVPWTVELPALPPALKLARLPPPAPAPHPSPKPAPLPMLPPLILSGKKPTPAPPARPASLTNSPVAAAAATLQVRPPETVLSQTPTNAPSLTATESLVLSLAPTNGLRAETVPSEPVVPPQALPGEPAARLAENPPAVLTPVAPLTKPAEATSPLPAPTPVPPSLRSVGSAPPAADWRLLWLAGLGGLGLVGLLLWQRQARRPADHVSLITRSLEREIK